MSSSDRTNLYAWIQRGGFLLVENYQDGSRLKQAIKDALPQGEWRIIPPDHEVMRSFHLLASLPQCRDMGWEGFHFDQRLAILLIPADFLSALDGRSSSACFEKLSREQATKIFINIMMVALTTDYKKDQVHLPEILKRLR